MSLSLFGENASSKKSTNNPNIDRMLENPKSNSCFNNLCKQVCSLFRKKPRTKAPARELIGGNRELCMTPLRESGSRSHAVSFDRNDPNSLATVLNKWRDGDGGNNTDTGGEDGEFIIYIPRVSRSKLQRKYLDPLQRANCNPILIQPRNLRRPSCTDTGRSELNLGRLRGTPLETLVEYASNSARDLNNNESFFDVCGEGSKTLHFFISSKSDPPREIRGSIYPFRLHERNICYPAIQQRHDTVARNRQRIMQERKDRLQNYFSTWVRRRQVGEMKKKLAKDNQSVICSPPNMLESRFHHIHWLGSGPNQNNSVGRYFDKEENTVVALKIFSDKPFKTILENLDNKLMAIQEIHALNHMNHKNIVKLLGYFELHDKYHLILESCDHSLRQEIEEAPTGLGTSISKKIIKYILSGLHFCHQVKCLHRDLSPENILVCRNGVAKIADFDRSAFITEGGVGNTSPTPGNFIYNSPEILAGDKEYGLPSDVWSLGIIFCELLTGKPLWIGKSAQSQLREIHNCVGPLLPRHACVAKLPVDEKSFTGVNNHAQLQQMFTTISPPCCSFIMKCLDVNPLCRFTCGELLQHQFMKGHYK